LRRRSFCALAVACLIAAGAAAQTLGRIATAIGPILADPVFFHGKQIAIYGSIVEATGLTRLVTEGTGVQKPRPVFILWREPPSRTSGEIRGEFWDLGRLREDDSRLSTYNLRPILETTTGGQWPPRDEVFVILAASLMEAQIPTAPTIRAIAMSPDRFADRAVSVVGRFRGRNLYGDLPTPLNRSRWDFVLQSADAAIWVSALRPKGRDFDLDPGLKADTGRSFEVSGTVRTDAGRVWIEADSMRSAAAQTETPVEITPVIKEPPPDVIFTAPLADETEVPVATTVRVQFSRDMIGNTFRGHVRVGYVTQAGAPQMDAPATVVSYRQDNRSLEIKFTKPLERFQTVRVELLDGITAFDGQPLKPWSMTFTTGG
jgi:hypothetical protein